MANSRSVQQQHTLLIKTAACPTYGHDRPPAHLPKACPARLPNKAAYECRALSLVLRLCLPCQANCSGALDARRAWHFSTGWGQTKRGRGFLNIIVGGNNCCITSVRK